MTGRGERRPQAARRQRGSVLLLAIVLSAVLAMLATAFIITARVERRAATNALRGAQAESACRAGLAAAIYRIELVCESVYGLDAAGSWHSYFEGGASDPSLCPPDTWVNHYNGEKFSNNAVHACRMAGKRFLMPIAASGDPAAALKRQKGFTAEYYVAVADLDGKLHCNPGFIANLLDAAGTGNMVTALGLSAAASSILASDNTPHSALGELRAKLVPSIPNTEWNDGEKVFTVYPRVASLTKADMGRPPVNVNTARKEVLKAIVVNVPGLAAKADVIAQKLVDKRPFANRKELEKALIELGDPAWPAPCAGLASELNEMQMNDLFNSLAGNNAAVIDESDYDQPATPGLYSYDFDNSDARDPTKGDHTALASDAETVAATWGTEVKFTSDFYHIYVLGRTVSSDVPPRVTAERRLHAVYDALNHRVLWLRWNFAAKANMPD